MTGTVRGGVSADFWGVVLYGVWNADLVGVHFLEAVSEPVLVKSLSTDLKYSINLPC